MTLLALLMLPPAARCPEPGCPAGATIEDRFQLESTHGPVPHVKTRCTAGHWFMMPAAGAPVAAARS